MPDPNREFYEPPTPAEWAILLAEFECTSGCAARLLAARSRTAREWASGKRSLPYPHLYALLEKLTHLETDGYGTLRITIADWRSELNEWLNFENIE
jgi:hypothetical protein